MPWDLYKTEQFYIQSTEPISIRGLAKKANRSKSLIGHWKVKHNWAEKRDLYWDQLTKMSHQKSLDKISDRLSTEAEDLAIEHLRQHQKFRQVAETLLNTMMQSINLADDPIAALKQLNIRDINYLSQVCDRAIKGEESSVGLKQQIDPNVAARTLESLGYVVIDPTKPPIDVN